MYMQYMCSTTDFSLAGLDTISTNTVFTRMQDGVFSLSVALKYVKLS